MDKLKIENIAEKFFFTVTSASPNTEGMNAITAWMLTCIFFVFGALGGYAFLLWRKKKSCLKRHRKVKITDEEAKTRLKKKEEHRSRVDDFFLVFFPGLCPYYYSKAHQLGLIL